MGLGEGDTLLLEIQPGDKIMCSPEATLTAVSYSFVY